MNEPKSISAYDTMLVAEALDAAIKHLEAMQQENDALRRENALLRMRGRKAKWYVRAFAEIREPTDEPSKMAYRLIRQALMDEASGAYEASGA